MSRYVRLTKGLNDKGILIKPDELGNYTDTEKDYYTSVYYYNEEQLTRFKETGTVKGIKDVFTDKIWFDLDSKDNPEDAKTDAIVVIERLKQYGIDEKNIEVAYSGNKGFHVTVSLNRTLTPKQVESLAINKFGRDLKTLDVSVYDSAQILRVLGTKHHKSGLYKIPISTKQLKALSLIEIKEIAKSLDNVKEEFEWETVSPDEEFFIVPKVEEKKKTEPPKELDLVGKPKAWKDWKWALLQGFFESGERHNALMVIASTSKALGYDKEQTYYLCKSALKKQAARSGQNEFDKDELWNNIIEQTVFSEGWEGGQYSPLTNAWVRKYCEKLGFKIEEEKDTPTITIENAFTQFKDYAKNIDSLTIKTGIPALDNKLRMTVGMSAGLIAAPGVGKTSIAIQMLNNMSKAGHRSVFFSYDMYSAHVFQKLVQKHFNLTPEDIFDKFKKGDSQFEFMVKEKLRQEYAKVDFCFESGQTVSDIMDTVKKVEDNSGEKVKFVVMDYNELVLTDFVDSTSSSSYVAQKMREMANTNQLCVFSLFQPNKMAGTPADEIKSYRSAKGSSAIEQSVSVMLGMSRPGFDPRKPDEDMFVGLNCLKNRMGPIFSLDLHWDGLTGSVRELEEEELMLLKEIRQRKEAEKKGDDWS